MAIPSPSVAGSPPSVTQSYYISGTDLANSLSNGTCGQITAEAEDSAVGVTILQIGAPTGTDDIQTYGGPVMTDADAVGALAACYLASWYQDPAHADQFATVAVTTDSDGDTAEYDQFDNGANFYVAMDSDWEAVNELFLFYANPYSSVSVAGAGSDVEPNFVEDNQAADGWLAGYSLEEEYTFDGLSTNAPELIDLVDDGVDYTNLVCQTMSCFQASGTASGQYSDNSFSEQDFYESFWGLEYDYGMPQIYDQQWPSYYAALDQSVANVNPTADDEKAALLPSWFGVLWQCEDVETNGSAAFSSANDAYSAFASATGQAPSALNEIHPDGTGPGPCNA